MNLSHVGSKSGIVCRAASLLAALSAGIQAGDGCPPVMGPGGEPGLEGLRSIQYTYSLQGGQVVVLWTRLGRPFDSIEVRVESGSLKLPGDAEGAQFELLPPGKRLITVEGFWDGQSTKASIEQAVLTTAPMAPVRPGPCLYYAFDWRTRTGLLEVPWEVPAPPDDPFLEFEFRIDGVWAGRYPADPDNADPDNAVTFSGIREGRHQVEITGVTWAYASPPAEISPNALVVPAPYGVELKVECAGGKGSGTVTYSMPRETPRETEDDAVAVWVTGDEGRVFRGYYGAYPHRILLADLPERTVQVELARARFEPRAEEPCCLSNRPGGPGAHAVAQARVNCQGRSEFRRGDASVNGQVNLTDAVGILLYLFAGAGGLPCAAAADIDDGGTLNISDVVMLLSYLFSGGPGPADPGPALCGEDPTPGDLGACGYDACSA